MQNVCTHLQTSQLLDLAWSPVDLEAQQLVVVQQLAIEVGPPILKQLKVQTSQRIVTFGDSTAEMLRVHQDRQRVEESAASNLWTASGLVFTADLGGWIDPNNFGRTMDGLVDSAGVARITPKGLRHTAQSIGRVVVGDDKVMQERLGHSDIGITFNTYTHTVTEQHRADVTAYGTTCVALAKLLNCASLTADSRLAVALTVTCEIELSSLLDRCRRAGGLPTLAQRQRRMALLLGSDATPLSSHTGAIPRPSCSS